MTRLLKAEQPKIVDGSTSNRLGSLVDFAILTGVGPFTAVSTIGTIAQPGSVPPAVESLANGIYSQQRSVCPTNEDHPPELLYGTDDYAQRMVFSGQLPFEVNDCRNKASNASNIRSGLNSTSASGPDGTDFRNAQLEAALADLLSVIKQARKKIRESKGCVWDDLPAIDKEELLHHIQPFLENLPECKAQMLAEVRKMSTRATTSTNWDRCRVSDSVYKVQYAMLATLPKLLEKRFKQHPVDEKLDKATQEYFQEVVQSITNGKELKDMPEDVRDHAATVFATLLKKNPECRLYVEALVDDKAAEEIHFWSFFFYILWGLVDSSVRDFQECPDQPLPQQPSRPGRRTRQRRRRRKQLGF